MRLQIVGRLLNLNGIKFYSTKEIKDEFGDAPALRWTIGQGQALPGLEEGMMGMRKGSLRKIIVPPAMGYAAGPNLLPQPSAAGRPSLDSVLKVKSDTRQHCTPSNTNLHRKILLLSNNLSSLFAAPVSDPSFPQPLDGYGLAHASIPRARRNNLTIVFLQNPRRDATIAFEVLIEGIK